jgi:transposase-like protein
MGRKNKVTSEEKISFVQMYLNGDCSQDSCAKLAGVTKTSFQQWIRKYQTFGEAGLISSSKNRYYSPNLKEAAVKDYLDGLGSLDDISKKYGLSSKTQLQNWIIKYNSHETLKSSGTGGTCIMTTGRKTTFDERIEIVKYCIEHQNNYAETAQKFEVSYQQVYTWTRKYESSGVEALQDKRGKRKSKSDMSELESLKAQNTLLEAQNRRQQMEIDFLKKLKEIERRRL